MTKGRQVDQHSTDPVRDTNDQFMERLRDLAMDWRVSESMIGQVVRERWAMDRPCPDPCMVPHRHNHEWRVVSVALSSEFLWVRCIGCDYHTIVNATLPIEVTE